MPKTEIKMTKNGILCMVGTRRIHLDPRAADHNGMNFVSHAHMDHLPARNGGVILSSLQTSAIASSRGFDMKNHVTGAEGYDLIDSGHILGSRGVLFDEIFYTGDICTRSRGFLRGADIPKCKILITECTFGLDEFVFPSVRETERRVNGLIAELYGRGLPVILMGYQLGKAQTLTSLFGHWKPLYFHDSVAAMNALHARLGVELAPGMGHTEAESRGLLNKKPWLMIAPLLSERNEFVQRMKERYGAVTVGFSGWAQSTRFSFGRKTDYSIPMSDHCDYNELLWIARRSGAEQVYTTHGFTEEFAASLRRIGISAEPLPTA